MRSDEEAIRALELYGDMVRRICFCHLKNESDTEDVFQNVFLKYVLHCGAFESEEHEKAWFIRVTVNVCKDYLRALFRHRTEPLDMIREEGIPMGEKSDVLEAVLSLPEKYKDVIYLHYYEGYSATEIGSMLQKKENTVYSLLSRGRQLLKNRLGGEDFE